VPEASVETVGTSAGGCTNGWRTTCPGPKRPAGEWYTQASSADEKELAEVTHQRDLQRRLFDAGCGICFPERDGARTDPCHQQAFDEEIWPYEYPFRLQVRHCSRAPR